MATSTIRTMMTAALAGALVLGTSACSSNINNDLLAEIDASNGHNVRLDAVVEGDWDSFLVVCPYDSPGVNERLGFEWNAAPDTNTQDALQTIVFVENDRVVSTTSLRFDDINLCTGVWPLMSRDTELQFAKPAKHVWHAIV